MTDPLTYTEKQILIGTLLGDGYCAVPTKKSKNARLVFRHGPKQKDWLFWKYNQLKRFFPVPPKEVENKGFGKVSWLVTGSCHSEITPFRHLFYPDGKKVITQEILDQVGPLAMMVWFADDGAREEHSLRLHTEGFSLTENELIAAHLSAFLKGPVKVTQDRDRYYLTILGDARITLKEMIEDLTPPSMMYKLQLPALDKKICQTCGMVFQPSVKAWRLQVKCQNCRPKKKNLSTV